jgi:hypothetical protein
MNQVDRLLSLRTLKSAVKIFFLLFIACTCFISSTKSISLLISPEIKQGKIHSHYFQLHKSLTKRYEKWLTSRLASSRATELSTHDISGTEWPLFGTVFYLWATESLQKAWEENPSFSTQPPREYAAKALGLSAELLLDPKQAHWVKLHWGSEYLVKENLFYRMLLISGLTSYQTITLDKKYEEVLRDQTISLAKEIDQSPHGLLDDYPNECYPVDILPAIAAIQRANILLQRDDSEFITKAKRGFDGSKLDPSTQLPAYICNSKTGAGIGPARGVGLSYMLIWAPEIWPETAKSWYSLYEKEFWHSNTFAAGWREFRKSGNHPDWYVLDVDAGPVIAGYGTGASAFGLGASLANGRNDHAYPLLAEAVTFSYPLADDSLLVPRLLSNASDAPLLGESALLFVLTRETVIAQHQTKSYIPGSVILFLSINLIMSLGAIYFATKEIIKS